MVVRLLVCVLTDPIHLDNIRLVHKNGRLHEFHCVLTNPIHLVITNNTRFVYRNGRLGRDEHKMVNFVVLNSY